jgi:type VI secretion system protein ImpK
MLGFADALGPWLDAGALQKEFDRDTGELLAGQRFYERLHEMRTAPETWIEAIEFYHACLCMGFRGLFLDDDEGLDKVKAEVFRDITAVRGDAFGPIGPNAARKEEQQGQVLRRLPAWWSVAGVAAAVLLAWLVIWIIAAVHAHGVIGALKS